MHLSPETASPLSVQSPSSPRGAHSRVPRYVRAAFDAFDANHSGYLDYRELRHALSYLGVDVGSDRAAAAVLYAYDDHPDVSMQRLELATGHAA